MPTATATRRRSISGTGVFPIEDDGPDAVVANATAAAMVLDETRPVGTETDGGSCAGGPTR